MPEFTLGSVEIIVFDEADRLFEMGFAEQLREIMKGIPEERQSLLFSATMPKQLVQFARAGLKDPALIRLDTESKISTDLRCVCRGQVWRHVRCLMSCVFSLYLVVVVVDDASQISPLSRTYIVNGL